MNKVIMTMIAVIIIMTGIIVGGNIYQKSKLAENSESKEEVEIAESTPYEEILDDCTDEWENMQKEKEAETLQVNSDYEKQDKYILREKKGQIIAYKVGENGEETEYLTTDISTDYLAEDDKENLSKRD